MGEFGEPLIVVDDSEACEAKTHDGVQAFIGFNRTKYVARAVETINALSGIRNVAAVKDVILRAKELLTQFVEEVIDGLPEHHNIRNTAAFLEVALEKLESEG